MNSITRFGLMTIVVLVAAGAFAASKKRIFEGDPDKIFAATLKVAKEHHVVSFIDDKHRLVTFHSGASVSSWGMEWNASVEPAGQGKSELILNPQQSKGQLVSWGAGGRAADKFFKWVEDELKANPEQGNGKEGKK
jgi:hypothetical protein